MADYDPARPGGAWEESGSYEETDGNNQENIQEHSTHQDQEEYSVDRPQHVPGDAPSAHGDDDDTAEYDPASVITSAPVAPVVPQQATEQIPVRPSPQPAPKKKPRAVGGFLVADSDDEDDAPAPPQSTGPAQGAAVSQSSVPSVPQQPSPASAVSKQATVGPSSADHASEVNAAASAPAPTAVPAQPSVDRIAQLEGRVQDDPRGAVDAWLALIAEHRARNDIEESRKVYERVLAIFPQAADIWIDYLNMELEMNNFPEAELIFNKSLMSTPNVNLWTKYLDYIRRRNDLADTTGNARQTVARAYEFVIDNIGLDKDSGKIWAEYIQFIKFGPGTVGGSQWQDQQKMDQLRKAYQRAVCVPIANVNTLWKEYDQFEMGLNKLTGRKYLAEKSPSYMSAKSANTALENITRGLQRTTLPRLPPAPGFDGDQEYMEQVEIWKKWIAWEKSDPLDLKDDKDQPGLYHKRILYVYNQALMALRFWPEMWVDAAQWCFDNNITEKDGSPAGLGFLTRGIEANPESVLLALKHADYIESTYPAEENDQAKIARGKAVRAPYDKVLDTLYGLIKKLKDREAAQVARIEEAFKAAESAGKSPKSEENDDEDDEDAGAAEDKDKEVKESKLQEQLRAIRQGYAAQTQLLSRTISFVWIALIRAMRRIQGKGKPNTELGGMRQAFQDARHRGRLTSDVYAAVAQLEWTIYKDPAGGKIFDRGAKLFPEDENFALENIKYLHSRDDVTNARVLFETVVNRLTQKPETVHKAKPLYAYFHKYESQFGELAQIKKLEKRMAELFPDDPKLATFTARYSTDKFDPIAARIIVSPAAQLKPKQLVIPSIEQPTATSARDSPRPPAYRASPAPQQTSLPTQSTNSPKRPLPADDLEDNPPRKIQRGNEFSEFQRGASPLKGAAGRRLDQQRRMQGQATGSAGYAAAPAPIARDITFLLSQIPRAEAYDYWRFDPGKMVSLLRGVEVPEYSAWKASPAGQQYYQNQNQPHGGGGGGGYRDSPAPGGGSGRPMSPYVGGPAGDGRRTGGGYRPPPPAGSGVGYEPTPPPAAAGFPAPAQTGYIPAPGPVPLPHGHEGSAPAWGGGGYAPQPPPPSGGGYGRYAPPGY